MQSTYFPGYYPKIRDCSPAAVWTDTPDAYLAWTMARKLGDGPFVIKDHIKSAKHYWHEACFVPKGSGRENFERIAENLKIEQGKTFFRGFVVKQYVPLRSRGDSPREYPMCEEYRLFFWKRQLLVASHYHRQPENLVDWSPFVGLAQRFDAPFFTMDVAQAETGNWIVVDMGAGECSSLPPSLEPTRFYSRLAEMIGTAATQIPPPTS
jgi:ATP-grasp domain, R2K clade family 3